MDMVLHSMVLHTLVGSTPTSATLETQERQSPCLTPHMLQQLTLPGQFHRRQPDSLSPHSSLHNRVQLTSQGQMPTLSRSLLRDNPPLLNRSQLRVSLLLLRSLQPNLELHSLALLSRSHQLRLEVHNQALLNNHPTSLAETALLPLLRAAHPRVVDLKAALRKEALHKEALLLVGQLQAVHPNHNQVQEASLPLLPMVLLLEVLPSLLLLLTELLPMDPSHLPVVLLLQTSPNLQLVDLPPADLLQTDQSHLLALALVVLLPEEDQILPLQVRLEQVLLSPDLDPHLQDLPEAQASLKGLQPALQARDYFG